jgi:hypothetical protein
MEPEGTCPPYWPELLWWLLHHPPPPGPGDPYPIEFVDSVLAAISLHTLATRLGDTEIGASIQKQAGEFLMQKTQEMIKG